MESESEVLMLTFQITGKTQWRHKNCAGSSRFLLILSPQYSVILIVQFPDTRDLVKSSNHTNCPNFRHTPLSLGSIWIENRASLQKTFLNRIPDIGGFKQCIVLFWKNKDEISWTRAFDGGDCGAGAGGGRRGWAAEVDWVLHGVCLVEHLVPGQRRKSVSWVDWHWGKLFAGPLLWPSQPFWRWIRLVERMEVLRYNFKSNCCDFF